MNKKDREWITEIYTTLKLRQDSLQEQLKIVFIALILITILLILTPKTLAAQQEKQIANFTNCYNLTIQMRLNEGNESPISFNGCEQRETNYWYCNCYSTDNHNWTLTMQTDNSILREPRNYDLIIKEQVFNYKTRRTTLNVIDWGDYTDLSNIDYDTLNDKIEPETKIIYVNNTIYTDRIKEVPKEVVKYVENTTRIEQLETQIRLNSEKNKQEIEQINKKYEKQSRNYQIITGTIATLGALTIITIILKKSKPK